MDKHGSRVVVFLLLVAAAWAVGLLYLIVRTRLPISVDLNWVDSLHVYVGLATLAFFLGIVAARLVPLLGVFVYFAVFVSGVVLLLPLAIGIRNQLVVAHLVAAVWSVPAAARVVWHSRRQVTPTVVSAHRRQLAGRLWLAIAIVTLPAAAFLVAPRALGPSSQIGVGQTWTTAALDGVFIDRLLPGPSGRGMVAGGDSLYVEENGHWQRVAFPSELILGLAVRDDPSKVLVGTSDGLYASQNPAGPYRKLQFPAREVHGIAIDPNDPNTIWATSRSGFWRSTDGGTTWMNESDGARDPSGAWALGYFGDQLFGSDALGVYEWDGVAWQRTSTQKYVVALDQSAAPHRLFASSMGEGLRIFDGRHWSEADQGLAAHGGGAVHVVSVTPARDRVFAATMLDGVAVSVSDGAWQVLGAGLPPGAVWRVLDTGNGQALAATDSGLYRYGWSFERPGVAWWAAFAVSALGASLISMLWLLPATTRRRVIDMTATPRSTRLPR